MNYKIEFNDDFLEEELIWKSKGYCSSITLILDKRRYNFNFYDPARLSQDLTLWTIEKGRVFLKKNLVVIPSIEKQYIETAIMELVETNQIIFMIPE